MKIRSNDDLTAALARIEALWGKEPGTPEGDELDILVDLVEHYERKHFPVAYIETTGRTQADLTDLIAAITPDNIHAEVDFGPSRGDEAF